MRTCVGVLVALLALLTVSAAHAQKWAAPGIGTSTLEQATARFGAPSYERRCPDGTTTVAWKQGPLTDAALQPAAGGKKPASTRGLMPGASERRSALVMKFAPGGSLVWARQAR